MINSTLLFILQTTLPRIIFLVPQSVGISISIESDSCNEFTGLPISSSDRNKLTFKIYEVSPQNWTGT